MKQNKRLDVIDLSYYIIFHLRKYRFIITIFELQDILVELQEYFIETHQQQLFCGSINIGKFGPEIKEVQEEFMHYRGDPILSRKTFERNKRVFLMKHKFDSACLKELTERIDQMTVSPLQDESFIDKPKIKIKR